MLWVQFAEAAMPVRTGTQSHPALRRRALRADGRIAQTAGLGVLPASEGLITYAAGQAG